jgi:hypothetical protein
MQIIDRARKTWDDHMAHQAQKLLMDNKGNAWRTTKGIRAQAFVVIGFITALFVLAFLIPSTTSHLFQAILVFLIAFCEGIVLGALISSTRGLLRLREDFLDERQLTLRTRIYYRAYGWLSAIVFLLIVAAMAVVGIKTNSFERPFTITFTTSFIRAFSLMIGALMTLISLPYIVLAFTTPGEEVETPAEED